MRIVADFHIHSPYARAVSRNMTLENLDLWARIKGIHVMGTGDFTHPKWMREIKEKLEPAEDGLFALKASLRNATSQIRPSPNAEMRFMLTVEISSIYSKSGKTRRIHNLIFSPSIASAEKLNAALSIRGNIASDGRPILGFDAKELAKIVFDIDPRAVVIPAHAWTPWFSVFGSMSGFDSLDECFDEYAKHIFAIETGLSSDPAMNWRWSHLDRISLISNSDAHSLQRIGREANVFELPGFSYGTLVDAIREKDPATFLYTVEFFPEEGKYHYDGHRACGVRFEPAESKKVNKRCPKCGKPLTIGVMHRVDELADRPPGGKPSRPVPFRNLVPLDEIIAESFDVGIGAKKVKEEYRRLVEAAGSEFAALVYADAAAIRAVASPEVAEGIRRVREEKLHIEPGYDGEYGVVRIFTKEERRSIAVQSALF